MLKKICLVDVVVFAALLQHISKRMDGINGLMMEKVDTSVGNVKIKFVIKIKNNGGFRYLLSYNYAIVVTNIVIPPIYVWGRRICCISPTKYHIIKSHTSAWC